MTKKFTKTGTLAQDTFSASIHGITEQWISEGECPAGTDIFNLRELGDDGFGTVYRFEIKQGNSFFTEETYGKPKLA